MKRPLKRKIPHRRVREKRTDYRVRLKLLKAGKPRLVVRKSTNNLVCQIVQHEPKGDRTFATVNIQTLRKVGWKGHGGSIPSAYLVGYACGTAAQKAGVKEAIADLGLSTLTKGSRLYAAVKGAVDAGLTVPHSPEVLPPEDRIQGKHLSTFAEKLKKENKEAYQKQFSGYLKSKLPPETLTTHWEETKKKIA